MKDLLRLECLCKRTVSCFRWANDQSVTKMEPIRIKSYIKAAETSRLMQLHTDKLMHEVFFRNIHDHGLSVKVTFSFPEDKLAEGPRNLIHRIWEIGMKVPDSRCSTCRHSPETIMYLLSVVRYMLYSV